MRYFGGKARIGKRLAEVLEPQQGRYWEPFCGMFSVGRHIKSPRYASDAHPDLILLLEAIRDGWVPPHTITEDEYNALKTDPPSRMRAFAGFGCSNSGKFFGGYARENSGRNFAQNAVNSLGKLRPLIQDVEFGQHQYTENIDADTIYCDPPYSNTTGFTVGAFDTQAFWKWVMIRSESAFVVVSEYTAPKGFVAIWEKEVRTDMNNSAKQKINRVEKLFVHESNLA